MFFKFALWNDRLPSFTFHPSLKFKWSAHFFLSGAQNWEGTKFFADEPIFGFKLYAPARLKQY